jgi:hypothetical protein
MPDFCWCRTECASGHQDNQVINQGKPERKGNMEFVIAVLVVAVLVYVILYVV